MSLFLRPHTEQYSIVDPIKPALDSKIIKDGVVIPEVRNALFQASEVISKQLKIDIKKAWLIGSSLTYQWTPSSDLDVTLFIEEKDQDKVKELNQILASDFNEKMNIAQHPVNFHFTSGRYYKFKADAIYDLKEDKWVKKPQALSEDDIEEIIRNCSSLKEFTDILEEYTELQEMLEGYNGQPEKLQEILEQTFKVSNMFDEIRKIRREEFKKKPEKDIPSANYRCSNVIYKLLEQYGLGNLAEEMSDFIQSRLKN